MTDLTYFAGTTLSAIAAWIALIAAWRIEQARHDAMNAALAKQEPAPALPPVGLSPTFAATLMEVENPARALGVLSSLGVSGAVAYAHQPEGEAFNRYQARLIDPTRLQGETELNLARRTFGKELTRGAIADPAYLGNDLIYLRLDVAEARARGVKARNRPALSWAAYGVAGVLSVTWALWAMVTGREPNIIAGLIASIALLSWIATVFRRTGFTPAALTTLTQIEAVRRLLRGILDRSLPAPDPVTAERLLPWAYLFELEAGWLALLAQMGVRPAWLQGPAVARELPVRVEAPEPYASFWVWAAVISSNSD